MIDEPQPRSPGKDVGWLALFLIVLGVIWFAQGGPSKLTSMAPYLKYPQIAPSNPAPSQSKTPNFFGESGSNPLLPLPSASPYQGKVSLENYGARETDTQREYLEIRAVSNTQPILITGWTLKGQQGLDMTIGNGAYLPYSGQVNPQEPIYLEPGGMAIVTTGVSPIGTNFRLNICTGYFNQFQKFIPSLSEQCPRISDEEVPQNFPEACFNFIRSIGSCRMPMTAVPPAAGNDCSQLVSQRANYSGCVTVYRNEKDFYRKEWRVYLGRDKELWQYRDTINLLDSEGKLVDRVSY